MLDLDGNVLHHLIKGGGQVVTAALSMGVKPHFLDGKAEKAFMFLVKHQAEHGSVPNESDVASMFGDVVVATDLAPEFVFQETLKRALFRRLADGVETVDKRLKANDPDGAYLAMQECLTASAGASKKNKTPVNLFALGQPVLDEYALVKSGVIGIPTPWPSINKMTMGWWPGTNSWFMARPGTGKTWLELIASEHAWKQRFDKENPRTFRQLIISAEMLKAQLAERFFVLRAKVNYGQVVSATLGDFAFPKFKKTIEDHAAHDGIWILDGSDDLSPSRIQEAIEELDIDLLVIDAAYRIQWMPKAKDRFENLFRGAEIISGWTKRNWKGDKKIAALVSSQMNRSGDKKGGASKQTAAALSDNIMWEADNAFGVEQSSDMKADGRLFIHTVKVRRMAEYKAKVAISWDMGGMNFGEVEWSSYGEDDHGKSGGKKFKDKDWKASSILGNSDDPAF